jgi:hypothetical protein
MILLEITAAAILALANNTNANENGFYYSFSHANGVVESQTVYKQDENGMLKQHLMYQFGYDDNNRLVTKQTYDWDGRNDAWTPRSELRYCYADSCCTLELAYWSKKDKSYTDISQKYEYSTTFDNNMTVAMYEWDRSGKEYKLTDKYDVMNASDDYLLAETIG